MKSVSICLRVALLVLLAVLFMNGPVDVLANDGGSDGLSGQILFGYRSVDVGGAERKYREDVNLEDGPRLAALEFDLAPTGEMKQFADRVTLDLRNFGGEPFETLGVRIHKFGTYDFTFDRTKSDYFYHDWLIAPELANPDASTGGDFHTFDFERVRDRAELDVTLSENSKLWFGFDRYTKRGESTTTLDVQRDEFELDQPIDETFYEYDVGYQYSWDKITLTLQERIRDYENVVEIFLPGFSEGENVVDDLTTLDFFFLDRPYDFTSNEHTARVVARPSQRWRIRAAASVQDLELDVELDEQSQGTDFNGDPFTTDLSGAGDVSRDVSLYEVDVYYLATDRVALLGGLYRRELDQDGESMFGAAFNVGSWELETTGVELGIEGVLTRTLTGAIGVTSESRDTTWGWAESDTLELERETTDRTGYSASLTWNPSRGARLSLSYEDNSYDDPFTLASPTDRRRFRLRGQYRWETGLFVSGIVSQGEVENTNSDWTSDTDQISARLGYAGRRLNVSAGYAVTDLERAVDQVVTGGSRQELFSILYEADSDYFDGRLRYKANERVVLGADLRMYRNDGSFALDRDDMRAYVEVDLAEAYLLHVGYRSIDYDENEFSFDDYDADIAELAVGYRY